MRARLIKKTGTVYILLTILLLAVFFSGLQAMRSGKRITFDGSLYDALGSQLMSDILDYSPREIWKILDKKMTEGPEKTAVRKYLDVPLAKHPPAVPYLIAASKTILGDNINSSRILMVLFRTAIVFLVFLICKEMWGGAWALAAAFFMAIDPVLMFCSQKIWIAVPMSFFIYAGIYLLFSGRTGFFLLYLSAASLGLAMLCKYVAVLAMIPLYVYLLFSCRVDEKKEFYYYLLPFMVFSPWLVWNFIVYGPGFIGRMIRLHASGTVLGPSLWYMMMIGGIALAILFAVAVLFAVRFFSGRDKFREIVINGIMGRPGVRKMFLYSIWGGVGVLLVLSAGNVVRSLDWFYFPGVDVRAHGFDAEPAYFYFSHLPVLSPVYLLSYLSVIFLKKPDDRIYLYMLIPAFVMVFFGFYGYYETRFIAMCTPALTILAVYTMKETFMYINGMHDKEKYIPLILFSVIIGFIIVKTLRFDLSVVIRNNFIYF